MNFLNWIKSFFEKDKLPVFSNHEDIRLDDAMDAMDVDDSISPEDDTDFTLKIFRQETAHSLDKNFEDSFFWDECSADAAAGMAKIFLRARCPTPYWRAIVSASEYKLWGGIVLARALAYSREEHCSLKHLQEVLMLNKEDQSHLIKEALSGKERHKFSSWVSRTEGLPVDGAFIADHHGLLAICMLFCAVGTRNEIDWPDLQPRLGHNDAVPEELPGLMINKKTLKATEGSFSALASIQQWNKEETQEILLVPDWACWLLAEPPLPVSFRKSL